MPLSPSPTSPPSSEWSNRDWFHDWFNSPYYETLYDHRDLTEAKAFVKNLTSQIPLPEQAEVLDLGCGWGRHTNSLADLGYRVTGLDLSPRLIERARTMANERDVAALGSLDFEVGDMRTHRMNRRFDLVVNLFTSLGYFEKDEDDLMVLQNAYHHLRDGGYVVLDYFDTAHTLAHLVPSETKSFPNFRAHLKRNVVGGRLLKEIRIEDFKRESGPNPLVFTEMVRCYSPKDLEDLLLLAGFSPVQRWTHYDLRPESQAGPRCIWLAQKPMNGQPRS